MHKNEILKILKKTGALVTNSHFVFTSGLHSDIYINKDAIYPHTKEISKLCKKLAEKFKNKNVDVVIAPTTGGIILSQWVAHHLSKIYKHEVLSTYAEKTGDKNGFVIKRGYDKLIANKRVLVVEDIVTTGGSVKKVVNCVKALKGKVVGVGALCNRGNVKKSQVGVSNFISLLRLDLGVWEIKKCPLCSKGIPINRELGKGTN